MSDRRVVKIGGSLLRRGDVVDRLRLLLTDLPPAESTLVVAGGGPSVRELRAVQDSLGADDEAAHWAAVDVMSANTRLLADAAAMPIIDYHGPDSVARGPCGALLANWLRRVSERRLARNWSVTSDSIAAMLAAELGAELLLCKSAPPPTDDLRSAAAVGYVDEFFPQAAAGVQAVAAVDLASRRGVLQTLDRSTASFEVRAGRST